MKFNCEPCNYATNDFPNFWRHSKTTKHIRKNTNAEKNDHESDHFEILVDHTIDHQNDHKNIKYTEEAPKLNNTPKLKLGGLLFTCVDCGKTFTAKTNMYRHRRTQCKQPIQKSVVEEIFELKEQLHEKDKLIQQLKAVTSNTFIYNF